MSNLLLEIGTEEIPARMIARARQSLRGRFLDSLRASGLDDGATVSVDATPRRLALFAQNVLPKQPDRTETLTGPSRRIAFDAEGNPTKAGLGFARKVGVPVEELDIGPDGKLSVSRSITGRPAAELLSEFLTKVVLGLRFPRAMYWAGKGSPRFIRPIRWIVALLDGEIVPFEIAGVASGRSTWGHRRLGPGPHEVRSAADYLRKLRDNAVILSPADRSRKIVGESEALVPPGCRIRRNARLLETLVYETEFPSALMGSFDPSYLSLPDEVLETVMLVHQKYFAVEDGAGELTNRFVAVANSGGDSGGIIRAGHERVLRARFNDARFFWDFDQRSSLAERVEDLKAVTFQASLGSYWDKTEASLAAAAGIGRALNLDPETAGSASRAVQLAKCDLTTEMVGEFPELQGKIGGLYAAAQGEPQAVADAIYDHYLPIGGAGAIPRSRAGCVASLADKLATLGGMFGLGLMPTGSKDPLSLRRAAFAAIRIVIEGGMPLSLDRLVEISGGGAHASDLRRFLLDRVRHWLQESGGFPPAVVEAVLAASDDVPLDILARARAVDAVRDTPDFEALAVSFKRTRNILEHAGGAQAYLRDGVDAGLLEAGAETDLYRSLETVAGKVDSFHAAGDYLSSLREIAVLRPALDNYFDEVLVMAKEESLRRNRLSFLAGLLERLSTVADFSAIDPEATTAKGR